MKKEIQQRSKIAVLGLSLLLLSACVSLPSSQQRNKTVKQLTQAHDWQYKLIHTAYFDLVSFKPNHHAQEKQLTVYIEGDGLAWLTKNIISTDPTPLNPTGLKLALKHPQGNAVYLARPCQYVGGLDGRNCTKHSWTDSRFSEHVIASTNEALNTLKAEFSAKNLQLIGYSGGGAVAALLAARRDDVNKLITVAGNIDHQAWTTHHRIGSLSNSLNPADYWDQLIHIPQIHFVGEKDKIMPPFLAQQLFANLSDESQLRVVVVPNQRHSCCWDEIWTELMAQP